MNLNHHDTILWKLPSTEYLEDLSEEFMIFEQGNIERDVVNQDPDSQIIISSYYKPVKETNKDKGSLCSSRTSQDSQPETSLGTRREVSTHIDTYRKVSSGGTVLSSGTMSLNETVLLGTNKNVAETKESGDHKTGGIDSLGGNNKNTSVMPAEGHYDEVDISGRFKNHTMVMMLHNYCKKSVAKTEKINVNNATAYYVDRKKPEGLKHTKTYKYQKGYRKVEIAGCLNLSYAIKDGFILASRRNSQGQNSELTMAENSDIIDKGEPQKDDMSTQLLKNNLPDGTENGDGQGVSGFVNEENYEGVCKGDNNDTANLTRGDNLDNNKPIISDTQTQESQTSEHERPSKFSHSGYRIVDLVSCLNLSYAIKDGFILASRRNSQGQNSELTMAENSDIIDKGEPQKDDMSTQLLKNNIPDGTENGDEQGVSGFVNEGNYEGVCKGDNNDTANMTRGDNLDNNKPIISDTQTQESQTSEHEHPLRRNSQGQNSELTTAENSDIIDKGEPQKDDMSTQLLKNNIPDGTENGDEQGVPGFVNEGNYEGVCKGDNNDTANLTRGDNLDNNKPIISDTQTQESHTSEHEHPSK
ncbi:hypothetical protein KUTeg_011321, partial [Tegillarca granosa]